MARAVHQAVVSYCVTAKDLIASRWLFSSASEMGGENKCFLSYLTKMARADSPLLLVLPLIRFEIGLQERAHDLTSLARA